MLLNVLEELEHIGAEDWGKLLAYTMSGIVERREMESLFVESSHRTHIDDAQLLTLIF